MNKCREGKQDMITMWLWIKNEGLNILYNSTDCLKIVKMITYVLSHLKSTSVSSNFCSVISSVFSRHLSVLLLKINKYKEHLSSRYYIRDEKHISTLKR